MSPEGLETNIDDLREQGAATGPAESEAPFGGQVASSNPALAARSRGAHRAAPLPLRAQGQPAI